MDRQATTSGLTLLWIFLSCFSSCWAQVNAQDLLEMCRQLNPLEAVIGTGESVSIPCDHGPGGLISLDWFQISVDGPEDGTSITIDGDKYGGQDPTIEINRISTSDEGLYRCNYVLQPSVMSEANIMGTARRCLYVLASAQYRGCDSSTPCQETFTASPGTVTFNTNVEYVDGGSFGQLQEVRRSLLYRGEARISSGLMYSCSNLDSSPCTDSEEGTVVQGETQNTYDFSVQLQLDESNSGVYTAFIDVYDPIANSVGTLSKTFHVTINATTTPEPTTTTAATTAATTTPTNSPTTGTVGTGGTDGNSQRGSDDSTTVVAVVVPLSIILVALLVVAVFGVAFVAVKHGGTRSSVYELNGELQEKKTRPESIIEEHYLPDSEPSMEVHV